MNRFAKSLLGLAAAFSFLFTGAACSSNETVEENVDNAVEDVKDGTEEAVDTVEKDVEGAENDVKDGTEEAIDDVADHVSTDTTVSIIEDTGDSLTLEALRDKDSLVDALEMLSEDGKLTFTTEDVDGQLKITSINDLEGNWVVYSSVNEYDGLAVTDEAESIDYEGKALGKAIVGVNEIPFVRENFFKIILE